MGNSVVNLCNRATGDATNQVNPDIRNLNPYDIPLESLTNDQINQKLRKEHVNYKIKPKKKYLRISRISLIAQIRSNICQIS